MNGFSASVGVVHDQLLEVVCVVSLATTGAAYVIVAADILLITIEAQPKAVSFIHLSGREAANGTACDGDSCAH